MNRLLLTLGAIAGTSCAALLAAAGLATRTPATRPTHGTSAPAPSCPYGRVFADGCPGAPAGGSFLAMTYHGWNGTWGANARQSGQTWAGGDHPWPWNAPGIDYAIGYAAGSITQDPATSALPAGCVYYASGHQPQNPSGPVIICANTANPDFEGFDFGGTIVGTNGCVEVIIEPTVTGTVTFHNFNFVKGANCVTAGYNHLDAFISAPSGGSASYVIENGMMDGNVANFPQEWNGEMSINTAGDITIEYVACVNESQRCGTINQNVLTVKYDYFEGWIMGTPENDHGEWVEVVPAPNSGTLGNQYYSYNVGLVPDTQPNGGTASIYFGGANRGVVLPLGQADHNIVVVNDDANNNPPGTTAAALVSAAYPNITTLYVSSNYIDPTGSLKCDITENAVFGTQQWGSGGSPAAGGSRNVDMIDGSLVTGFDGFPYGPICPGALRSHRSGKPR